MYEMLNLKAWPFLTVPTDDFAAVWAGRPQTRRQLERLLRRMQLAPKSALDILWANFGMGKTHTLLHLKHHCLQTQNKLVPIYAVMPKRSTGFLELYRAIIHELPYEYLSDQLVRLSSKALNGVALHPMFQRSPGVVRALLTMRNNDIEATVAARQWLAAQPGLSNADMRAVGVSYRIKTPEDALNALSALVNLAVFPAESGRRVVVMLDEYQRIGELRPKIMSEINASMHTFYNNHPTGLELVLSFSFGNRENVEFLVSDELKSRAEPQHISLDVLTTAEGVEFLRDLLAQFRLQEDERWAYPFTPQAIEGLLAHIGQRKPLTPRRIMLYANHVLTECLMDGDPDPEGISFEQLQPYLEDPSLGSLDTDSEVE